MAAHRPGPEWSLTGIQVRWPDGQPVSLWQSAWTRSTNGWTSIVSVPRRANNGDVRFVTARVHVRDITPPTEAAGTWLKARDVLTWRMRARGVDAGDLGDIVLGQAVRELAIVLKTWIAKSQRVFGLWRLYTL